MYVRENLIYAACSGNVEWVRRILQSDPGSVNARDSHIGTTPLHCAAHRGFLEITQALIEAGADVNSREVCCAAIPLHWAAEVDLSAALALGEFDRADEMLKSDPSLVGPTGAYRLLAHFTTRGNLASATSVLLDNGADPNVIAEHFHAERETICALSPLHVAAWRGHAEVVQILLDHGASRRLQDDKYESTPFILAKWHHHDDLSELLRPDEAPPPGIFNRLRMWWSGV